MDVQSKNTFLHIVDTECSWLEVLLLGASVNNNAIDGISLAGGSNVTSSLPINPQKLYPYLFIACGW